MSCKNCGLHIHSAPTCIQGCGSKKADIMIINSLAGDLDESEEKAIMDDVLKKHLQDIGIDLKRVYYTNAIKCRTPKGTKVKITEVKRCKKYLDDEIKKVNPKFVLAIGAQATKALTDEGITSINGVIREKDGYKYMATFAPGIIYRDPGKAPYVIQAFNNFKDMVKGIETKLPELNIKFVKNKREIIKALHYLEKHNYRQIAYDIETRGLDRYKQNITLFGFGNDKVQFILPLEVKYSPLRGKKIAQINLMRFLIKRLNNITNERIGQNGKFDDLFIEEVFGVRPDITFDTMLASHALDENTPNGLKENAVRFCGAKDWDINKKLKTGNVQTKLDYEQYTSYLGYDVFYTFKLKKKFRKLLRQDMAIYKIFKHIYMPASKAYEDIQKKGAYVRQKQFKEAEKYLKDKLADIEKRLKKYTKGKEINWNSPKQVGDFLYKDLKLPILEKTESGAPATGESILLRLRDKHPAVEVLLEYRGVHIQISHFITGWQERMVGKRLHPNFKLHGTVTGRTSSNDPNLQQVPRDKIIRSLIGAPEGRVFVEADLSQAELRIAAMMSGDHTMKLTYQTGGDIHNTTYNAIAEDRIEDEKDPAVKKEKRKKAKAVNFGFLYGMGWKKFQEYARDTYGLKLTDKEAKEYRKRFFMMYTDLPAWHDRQRKIVHALKQVRSPIGRLRRLPDIDSSEKSKVAEAERQSINSPVQGFGSDITLLGLCELMGYAKYYNPEWVVDKSKFDCIGTVHDSILCEVDEDYVEEFVWKIKNIVQYSKVLTKVFKFNPTVPIIMDVSVGKTWGNCKELDFNGDWKKEVKNILKDIKQSA
jgi:DNA polymerase-1